MRFAAFPTGSPARELSAPEPILELLAAESPFIDYGKILPNEEQPQTRVDGQTLYFPDMALLALLALASNVWLCVRLFSAEARLDTILRLMAGSPDQGRQLPAPHPRPVLGDPGWAQRQTGDLAEFLAALDVPRIRANVVAEKIVRTWASIRPIERDPVQSDGNRHAATRRVLVVHGRDIGLRSEITALFKELGLEPVFWAPTVSKSGATPSQSSETMVMAFKTTYAVVVLISDADFAGPSSSADAPVHMEMTVGAGYALSSNPARTLVLHRGVHLPDQHPFGERVMRFDGNEESRREAIRRLSAMGYNEMIKIHVGVLSFKEEEYEALLDKFKPSRVRHGKNRSYDVAEIETPNGICRVAVTRAAQGNLNAQTAATELLGDLAPTFVLVVGIAGGIPTPDFSLGDVVISDYIQDLTLEDTGTSPEARRFNALGGPLHPKATRIVERIRSIERTTHRWSDAASVGVERPTCAGVHTTSDRSWNSEIDEAFALHSKRSDPKATARKIASSDRLIKDPDLLRNWRTVLKAVSAVEMESAGVYILCQREGVPVLAIRGISDIVGWKRDEAWTLYACHTAAAFAKMLVSSGVFAEPKTPPDDKLTGNPDMNSADASDYHGASAANPTPPRIFISYSHDTNAHVERVLLLANQLRDEGFDIRLDQYVDNLPEGWTRWMQRQIEEVDFVLFVCSTTYRARFEGRAEPGSRQGATWEGFLATQVLRDANSLNTRFVPVYFDDSNPDDIPVPLRAATCYRLPDRYDDLYRQLAGPLKTAASGRVRDRRWLGQVVQNRGATIGQQINVAGSASFGAVTFTPSPSPHTAARAHPTEPAASFKPAKILLFTANAADQHRMLALESELRMINDALQRARLRDHYNLQISPAITFAQLVHDLDDHAPRFVHFGGHGDATGALILKTHDFQDITVSVDHLRQLFAELCDQPDLVVFATCHSRDLAAAVSLHVGHAIGFSGPLQDLAAPTFSAVLYERLAARNPPDVRRAFRLARLATIAAGFPDVENACLFDHTGAAL